MAKVIEDLGRIEPKNLPYLGLRDWERQEMGDRTAIRFRQMLRQLALFR